MQPIASDPVVVYAGGHWCVQIQREGRTQEYCCASEDQARRFAATLARQVLRIPSRGVRAASRVEPLPLVRVLRRPLS